VQRAGAWYLTKLLLTGYSDGIAWGKPYPVQAYPLIGEVLDASYKLV